MAMLKDGERDYFIGKKLLDEGFYDKSVYHFQQSVEKCIKSILIAFGIFQKTHFVGGILIETLKEQNMPESWKKKLHRISEISEGIEPEVSLSRYPAIIDNNLWLPFEEYEKTDAEKARINADDVLSVTKDFLKYWFQW
jgi:HEPN domain-containing protein